MMRQIETFCLIQTLATFEAGGLDWEATTRVAEKTAGARFSAPYALNSWEED
jgi:hypothetical protein